MSTLPTFENLHFHLTMPHQHFLLSDLNEATDSQIIMALNALRGHFLHISNFTHEKNKDSGKRGNYLTSSPPSRGWRDFCTQLPGGLQERQRGAWGGKPISTVPFFPELFLDFANISQAWLGSYHGQACRCSSFPKATPLLPSLPTQLPWPSPRLRPSAKRQPSLQKIKTPSPWKPRENEQEAKAARLILGLQPGFLNSLCPTFLNPALVSLSACPGTCVEYRSA